MSFLRFTASGAGAFVFSIASSMTFAQSVAPVTLQSVGGDITLVGQLVSASDHKFTIATPDLGNVRVSADDFTCSGAACPDTADRFAIRDMADTAPGLVTGLLEGYASAAGLEYEMVDAKQQAAVNLVNPDGSVRTRVDLAYGAPGLGDHRTDAAIGVAAWRMPAIPVDQ